MPDEGREVDRRAQRLDLRQEGTERQGRRAVLALDERPPVSGPANTRILDESVELTVKDETSFHCGSLANAPNHGETAVETMPRVSEDVWGDLLEGLPVAVTVGRGVRVGNSTRAVTVAWAVPMG
mgnify:CR=1 FL=1